MAGHHCIINIHNLLSCPLTLVPSILEPEAGVWSVPLPQAIQPRELHTLELREVEAEPRRGSAATVSYRINLPYGVGEWHISLSFTCDSRGQTYKAFTTFTSEGSTVPCRLIQAYWATDPGTGPALRANLQIQYHRNLRTRSQVTSVSIEGASIKPYIRNTHGKAILTTNGMSLVMWRITSISEYEDNSDSGTSGSFSPVAVDVTNPLLRKLKVEVDIFEDELLGVPLTLYGDVDFSHRVVSSSQGVPLCFLRRGLHEVSVTVSPPWARTDAPWGLAGNVTWKLYLSETGQTIGLNFSRLEFYALQRELPPFYLGNVVPVTLMRRFVLPLRDPQTTWLRHCCDMTFSCFSFAYDVVRGAPSYNRFIDGNKKSQFKIQKYCKDIGRRKTVNCYDQASMMHICLSLSPTTQDSRWMYMDPFGALNTTVLVGWGACNNPFWSNSRAPIVCDNNSPQRTAFGNHAFIQLSNLNIADTCCGPHYGDETLGLFLARSIDTTFTSVRAGGITNVQPTPGVVELEFSAEKGGWP